MSSRRPLLSLWKTTGKFVSAVLSETVTVEDSVAVAAVPLVSAALLGIEPLTREMLPVPSKETPPIVLAVASLVAEAASVAFAGVMLAVPSKEVPPMVRAVASAVAEAASVAFAGVMLAVPSKEVPPMVRAVASAVAVAAVPLVSAALLGIEPLTRVMLADPSKETPPIVLAVASAVAVAALPDMLLEVRANVPAEEGRVTVTSAVEAGPIRVTLFVPLSLSS